MGIKCSGDSLRNHRICSRYFSRDIYNGSKLRRQTVPTLFPAVNINNEQVEQVAEFEVVHNVENGSVSYRTVIGNCIKNISICTTNNRLEKSNKN